MKSEEMRLPPRLTVTRRWAAALLGFATLVFAVTTIVVRGDGWLGYVQATAEASMVGATRRLVRGQALFRHPLGGPIPPTAIPPRTQGPIRQTLG